MQRFAPTAAGAVAAALLALVPTAQAAVPMGTPGVAAGQGRSERAPYAPDRDRILCQLNTERAKYVSYPALEFSTKLGKTAQAHSEYMARTGDFGTDEGDEPFGVRLRAAGVYGNPLAEYVLQGYESDAQVVDYLTDPSNTVHSYLNDGKYTLIGIGYEQGYWTVDLSGPNRRAVGVKPHCD